MSNTQAPPGATGGALAAGTPAGDDPPSSSQTVDDDTPDSSGTDDSDSDGSDSGDSDGSDSDDSDDSDSAPDSGDASPPSSQAPDSGGCAEIPAAPHAVLVASVQVNVELPRSTDEASQMPYKFTLTNDDGSYSKTLTLASDCKAGDSDGTSVLTFEDLTEDHTYSLQCDDGDTTYDLFQGVSYEDIPNLTPAAPPTDLGVGDHFTKMQSDDDAFAAAVAPLDSLDGIPSHDPENASDPEAAGDGDGAGSPDTGGASS